MRDYYVHTALLFAWCLLLGYTLSAQAPQPALRHYTTDDGLPSSECYEIIQDRAGYIWISTDNGISRFDGYTFKNFGTTEGMLDKTVLVMKEDHRGWIWMSTFSGNFYIHRGDTIAAYAHNRVLQEIRSKYYTVSDFVVKEDGSLIASLKDFNFITITASGEWSVLDASSLKEKGRTLIWQADKDNVLYVDRYPSMLSEEQVYENENYWNKNLWRITLRQKNSLSDMYQMPAYHMDKAKKEDGTQSYGWNTKDGYLSQHLDSLYFIPVLGKPDFQIGKSTGYINCLLSLPENGYYIGYNKWGNDKLGGIKYFSSMLDLLADTPQTHFLLHHTVSHVLKDKSGGLWMATTDDGVFYAASPEVLTVLPTDAAQGNDLRRIELYQQGFLFGGATGGIYQLDNRLSIREHSQIANLTILDDFFVLDGTIYISSPLRYFENSAWQDFTYYRLARKEQIGPSIKKMRPSVSPNRFWAIKTFKGLFKFKWENQKLVLQDEFALSNHNKLTAVAEEPHTNLWVGCLDGLFQLDQAQAVLIPLESAPIFQERVEDICVLPGGGIAVGTRGSGLYLLQNDKLTIWTEAQGLSSNTITQLQVVNNVLWAASNNGLNRIPLDKGISGNYVYTKKDGLPEDNIVDMAFDGTHVMLLTKDAITQLTQVPIAHGAQPALYIEKVLLNGKPVEKTALSQLHWQENNLQLGYHLLDYSQDGRILYRFRLSPDVPWVYTKNNTLDLLNLSPGDYTLEIQAKDRAGRWAAAEPLQLGIRPPFWQRLWFVLLCILLAFLIGYQIFRQRLANLAVQQERLTLEEQINQLKQQAYRAQMNPHFIFNALNAIQGLILGEQLEKEKAVGFLSNFSRLIRIALDASSQDKIPLKQEVELLDNYLALEQMRFDNNFSYTITFADDLEVDWILIPPLLIQPYVENAVLHGMENRKGDGQITIQLSAAHDMLTVCVTDNGPGIYYQQTRKAKQPDQLKRKSHGMNITKQRLDVLDQDNNQLQIKELHDPQGRPIGTEIVLKIPISYAE